MNTNSFPNFLTYGYRVIELLNHNYGENRKTYLAETNTNKEKVVIKVFDFQTIQQLERFEKAFNRETENLKRLNISKIERTSRFLDEFKASNGELCLVQEFIEGNALNKFGKCDPDFVRVIAISILEILCQAQSLKPPLIHGDIKPENVLVDSKNNAYIIDFGYSRFGEGRSSGSSTVAGTDGFMPREFLRGAKEKGSDLFSLGVTLVCLLTGTPTQDAARNLYFKDEINLKLIENKVSRDFLDWLKKMVAGNLDDRFPDAQRDLRGNKIPIN